MTKEKTISNEIYFNLTQPFACGYLDNEQEQLLTLNENDANIILYDRLLNVGFRRSGGTIYKPHCPNCNKCQPIRIPVADFKQSKRQKRTYKKNHTLTWKFVAKAKECYYPLYEKYINLRHQDGSMYPASLEQYQSFLLDFKIPPYFIEVYSEKQLIAVSVTDLLPNSLSAVYSFFDPDFEKMSLGSYLILLQIELAKQLDKQYVYLGYQIDNNRKMNYKTSYRPYEKLTESGWQRQDS
ncbi:MAG: arginyltransferase [Parashewanella sp.]